LLCRHDRIGVGGGVELHAIQVPAYGRIHLLEKTPTNLGLAAGFQPGIGGGGDSDGEFFGVDGSERL
jgi:hypothetical protein